MTRHDDRLRDALLDIERSAPAEAPPPLRPGADRRLVWVLGGATAVAAVLVGVVVAGTVWGDQRGIGGSSPTPAGSASPSGSTSPSASPRDAPTASPTAAPTPTPLPGPTSWQASQVQPWPGVAVAQPLPVYRGIAWLGDGRWLVYGRHADGRAGLWLSADGREWTEAQGPTGQPDGLQVTDVVENRTGAGSRYVAVGIRLAREDDPAYPFGAYLGTFALTSDDAVAWSLAETPTSPTILNSVTVAPSGFIAVGVESDVAPEALDGRIWTSVDGRAWTESAPADLVDSSLLGVETIAGRIVAVGVPNRLEPPAAAWTSGDGGATWASSEFGGVTGLSVSAAGGASVLMTGTTADGGLVASSADGLTWTTEALHAEFPTVTLVAAGDAGAVIVGVADIADGPFDMPVWSRSSTAEAWQPIDWQNQVADVARPWTERVGFTGVAVGAERSAFLLADGRVLLSPGPLP